MTDLETRIGKRFAALKAEHRAGLVTFVTAGDPDLEAGTVACTKKTPKNAAKP